MGKQRIPFTKGTYVCYCTEYVMYFAMNDLNSNWGISKRYIYVHVLLAIRNTFRRVFGWKQRKKKKEEVVKRERG